MYRPFWYFAPGQGAFQGLHLKTGALIIFYQARDVASTALLYSGGIIMRMVQVGFEPTTSPASRDRSTELSYRTKINMLHDGFEPPTY